VRKFTDEELSRVLSAHEAGQLQRKGKYRDGEACLLAAALPAQNDAAWGWDWGLWHSVFADGELRRIYRWFDESYSPAVTADEFLRQLEAQGLA
jgi:hypothetical protein